MVAPLLIARSETVGGSWSRLRQVMVIVSLTVVAVAPSPTQPRNGSWRGHHEQLGVAASTREGVERETGIEAATFSLEGRTARGLWQRALSGFRKWLSYRVGDGGVSASPTGNWDGWPPSLQS